ncbi:hydroxymethylglutaryl-CoA synthase [Desulfocucumis palustris]|uniref:Hydroxymethylglutaryl-CoA synthase n=1 Tax=Desulfocucumis palustris TaxID=1898651 RepID=A0A2L2XAH7_9FIRM|nr:OB-fold domain-containing protein [Desulfocucumis palustris]GBF33062.1 hydroxymethylglutaryl-CoA synthase [Desulfocucumis palustris]
MLGIVAYGAYIPFNRLDRKRYKEFFGEPAPPGEKAVANYDEDSVSMAVEAARDCLSAPEKPPFNVLYFATSSPPYGEKQSAATVAAALDSPRQVRAGDYTCSLRSGSGALLAGFDAVASGAGNALVTVADCRLGAPQSQWEQISGDGAAAFLLGSEKVLASLEGHVSISAELLSQWREPGERFVRGWEERFYISRGYNSIVRSAVEELLKKKGLKPSDINRLVLYGPSPRYQMALAKSMGFDLAVVQDSLFSTAGQAGAANAPMMLAAALEEAAPGDLILLATFGEGSDAILFRATEKIRDFRPGRGVKGHLASKKTGLNYNTYLKWRQLLEYEPPRRPDFIRPSAPAMFRELKKKYAFYGSLCTRCATPQFPRQRVCVNCQARDEMREYCFADKKARVATYAIDYLTFSQDPPTVLGVLDFQGGGRILCEMTDCDIDKIEIGMEVEMSFRKLYTAGGVHNYFWKARPKRQGV